MRKDPRVSLFLAHAGMELTWLYAWATFLMTAIMHRPFPLHEAIATFFLAVALNLFSRRISLRVISRLALHILGFFIAASRIVYTCFYHEYAYFDKWWLTAFFGKPKAQQEWLILVIILILVLLFWVSGVALTRRTKAYLTICIRFDYGVGAFFCLFILKLLLFLIGGVEVKDPAPLILLFPFFIFSLLAISLSRNSDTAQRHFLANYRGVGMLTGFTVMVLAFGAGLVLFFTPHMMTAAKAGSGLLKSIAGPLLPVLERMLKFILGARSGRESLTMPAAGEGTALISSGQSSWWEELVTQGLGGGLAALLLLMGLILGAVGSWYLLRWLLSKTSQEQRKPIHWQDALLWAQRLLAAIGGCFKGTVQKLKGYRNAVQLYRAFLRWGRRSGQPHFPWETPAEYGSRLRKQFPALNSEIGGIVDAFNLKIYGEADPDEDHFIRARRSWKKLRSPRYWPARVKSWFFRGKR